MPFTDKIKMKKIEKLRSHLINVGMEKGLTHPNTIKASQDLDKLLNEYGTK
ncbi:aspartyl-phosphate phosphatase Spo0E family protein [Solibacillus sp. R5-41]|uniref:aspartyl-phosphate phosphatase Spo0E family protein n=1 Tax=Solibacillus sp. R5-41 TaxID=2048654 RepID=UPI0020A4AB8D|nr:aspartyl-phosphate phosphatase Spo0E family protein [Solibacillus sp. R5-41]